MSNRVNRSIELATSSSEKEPGEFESERSLLPDWSLLPDVVLTIIFGCLSDVNRHRMALVCSRWSRVFNSPCLWRHRHYQFGGVCSSRDTAPQRAIGFARKHGHALRYLRFECEHPNFNLCKQFQKTATHFFSTLRLRNCRLDTFVMRELHIDTHWHCNFTRGRLVTALTRFLKRQTALELFAMSNANFGVNNGFKVS